MLAYSGTRMLEKTDSLPKTEICRAFEAIQQFGNNDGTDAEVETEY